MSRHQRRGAVAHLVSRDVNARREHASTGQLTLPLVAALRQALWPRVPLKRHLPIVGGTAFVLACLAGCGAGHGANPSAGTVNPRATSSHPATTNAKLLTGAPPPAKAYWSYAALIGRLAGRTLAVSSGTIRLDSALIECNGEGDAVVSGRTRRWNSYTCTQTAFQAGGDHDVTFDVEILSATQLRVTSVHKGPE